VGDRLEHARFAPSGRSLLVGVLILLAALGLYAAARTTSMFAVDRVAVTGVPNDDAAAVRKALAPALGESLLGLDLADLERRAESVPTVASATLDRAFPHTLAIEILPEVPVAVLRQGAGSWLAAAGGRVIAELEQGQRPGLPRVWLKRDVDVRVGEWLGGAQLRAVNAVAPLVERPLPIPVASVVVGETGVTLELRSGLELRLGDLSDLAVKLEVARQVIPQLAGSGDYLDVSVSERPVAGESLYSQVEVESSTSTPTEGSD
jgi:cell division protein FtsQ